MASRIKQPKQTHVNVRHRRPDGDVDHRTEEVVQRAPLRAATYSVGERCQIIELMIFCLVDREFVAQRDITHLIHSNLELQKCKDLLILGPAKPRLGRTSPRLQIADMWRQLVELRLLKTATRRHAAQSRASITPKGMRHIKKQPKRLRLCAQKLVYTELLEKLARAVG